MGIKAFASTLALASLPFIGIPVVTVGAIAATGITTAIIQKQTNEN